MQLELQLQNLPSGPGNWSQAVSIAISIAQAASCITHVAYNQQTPQPPAPVPQPPQPPPADPGTQWPNIPGITLPSMPSLPGFDIPKELLWVLLAFGVVWLLGSTETKKQAGKTARRRR